MSNIEQPIIIKRVKKRGHAGHHGGAWKVAYADFVTAMMAFFLMMWLVGSTTKEQKAALSDYFTAPSEVEGSSPQPTQHSTAVQGPGGASTSMIQFGGALNLEGQKTRPIKVEPDESDPGKENDGRIVEKGAMQAKDSGDAKNVEGTKDAKDAIESEQTKDGMPISGEQEQQRLQKLKEELTIAIGASEAMAPYKDQLLIDIIPEGLQIQIVDEENRPMFDVGSVSLKGYSANILAEIGLIINSVPNKISITGHTDATPYGSAPNYSNWELSADRANAARRALLAGGMDENKVSRVVGLASTVPFIVTDPSASNNRRISIIVINRALDQPGEAAPTAKPQPAAEENSGPGAELVVPAPKDAPSAMHDGAKQPKESATSNTVKAAGGTAKVAEDPFVEAKPAPAGKDSFVEGGGASEDPFVK